MPISGYGVLVGRAIQRRLGTGDSPHYRIDHFVQRAMGDETSLLYAFGQRWGPETAKDKIFGFKPGNGVHDIHMNQGNSPKFKGDDGVWQDGGLLFHFPKQNQWVGMFLKFQSQAWHTDDATGHATTAAPGPQPPTPPLPTGAEPNGLIRIVGAMANSIQSPEVE